MTSPETRAGVPGRRPDQGDKVAPRQAAELRRRELGAFLRGLIEWEQTVYRLVAQYRLAMADHVGEPAWRALIARLSDASPEFVRVWEEHGVLGPENQTKLVMNEKMGLLRLDTTNYWLGPRPGSGLVVYTPADRDCRERLEKLAADL